MAMILAAIRQDREESMLYIGHFSFDEVIDVMQVRIKPVHAYKEMTPFIRF